VKKFFFDIFIFSICRTYDRYNYENRKRIPYYYYYYYYTHIVRRGFDQILYGPAGCTTLDATDCFTWANRFMCARSSFSDATRRVFTYYTRRTHHFIVLRTITNCIGVLINGKRYNTKINPYRDNICVVKRTSSRDDVRRTTGRRHGRPPNIPVAFIVVDCSGSSSLRVTKNKGNGTKTRRQIDIVCPSARFGSLEMTNTAADVSTAFRFDPP